MTLLQIVRVTGNSLEPGYREGDFALISGIPFLFRPPRNGDVVVFKKPPYGTLIKTVANVDGRRKEIEVRGSHAGSVDSRVFGPLPFHVILGRVIWHIRKD